MLFVSRARRGVRARRRRRRRFRAGACVIGLSTTGHPRSTRTFHQPDAEQQRRDHVFEKLSQGRQRRCSSPQLAESWKTTANTPPGSSAAQGLSGTTHRVTAEDVVASTSACRRCPTQPASFAPTRGDQEISAPGQAHGPHRHERRASLLAEGLVAVRSCRPDSPTVKTEEFNWQGHDRHRARSVQGVRAGTVGARAQRRRTGASRTGRTVRMRMITTPGGDVAAPAGSATCR